MLQKSLLLALCICLLQDSDGDRVTGRGDDDRQWLSFWLIYLMLTAFESLTDVLLWWLPIYFEMKFLLLIWLIFFKGADILYRKVHSMFQAGNRLLVQISRRKGPARVERGGQLV